MYIYIYIDGERERESKREREGGVAAEGGGGVGGGARGDGKDGHVVAWSTLSPKPWTQILLGACPFPGFSRNTQTSKATKPANSTVCLYAWLYRLFFSRPADAKTAPHQRSWFRRERRDRLLLTKCIE